MSFRLAGQCQHVPERGEWVGVVCRLEGEELTVLCIGCELTKEEAAKWVIDTINLMREQDRLDVQAPDMYDRGRVRNEIN